jgi:small GTP-binding protein
VNKNLLHYLLSKSQFVFTASSSSLEMSDGETSARSDSSRSQKEKKSADKERKEKEKKERKEKEKQDKKEQKEQKTRSRSNSAVALSAAAAAAAAASAASASDSDATRRVPRSNSVKRLMSDVKYAVVDSYRQATGKSALGTDHGAAVTDINIASVTSASIPLGPSSPPSMARQNSSASSSSSPAVSEPVLVSTTTRKISAPATLPPPLVARTNSSAGVSSGSGTGTGIGTGNTQSPPPPPPVSPSRKASTPPLVQTASDVEDDCTVRQAIPDTELFRRSQRIIGCSLPFSNGTYDYQFKVIMFGDSGVGKSSLIKRLSDGKFDSHLKATIGVEFVNKVFQLKTKNQEKICMQVWDTAGQEKFRAITTAYFRGASAMVCVFDVGKKSTFESLCNPDTLSDALQSMNQPSSNNNSRDRTPPIVVVIGNKIDQTGKARKVSCEQATRFCERNRYLYFECSAKDGTRVQEAFEELTALLYETNCRSSSVVASSSSDVARKTSALPTTTSVLASGGVVTTPSSSDIDTSSAPLAPDDSAPRGSDDNTALSSQTTLVSLQLSKSSGGGGGGGGSSSCSC